MCIRLFYFTYRIFLQRCLFRLLRRIRYFRYNIHGTRVTGLLSYLRGLTCGTMLDFAIPQSPHSCDIDDFIVVILIISKLLNSINVNTATIKKSRPDIGQTQLPKATTLPNDIFITLSHK
ncbi:hypothetical protein BABINDRAFT_124615 [Babjeviella inositovora NRRL Y-12698]|uniref:Uncharacterized protein n=1 Tax=Babjeviella inositovora NRRL Y-12698 TaxID=984486 RepID=A0A1E3QS59_9ASCO|nr:uncharacterized protein BABINDRAFT_124615 [Babjeviella inositovora NRRL Y-12698]ODQ80529.1 hypothetical protein BABINDRAFT_124615 [Babjeviella inositovora NRRL Y-12698]